MSFPNNLPQQLTSFIGRRREMAEVRRLLSSTRLLTLTGAGGCGKTRLALQVAGKLTKEYRDGVWFVDLASLANHDLVAQAVAFTLGVKEQQGRTITETLVDYLQSKKMLLILDNCDHLVAACASLVDTLLCACSDLCVFATSRQPLGVTGETVWRVPSLSLPDPQQHLPVKNLRQYDSVQLFTRRALLKRENFSLAPNNAITVAQLCNQLDGIPLAIELAAARMSVLSLEEIVERLDERFNLLASGSRTAIPRHQTLQATLDWSYNLLSETEQSLLRALSVFAGGCTLEAIEAVLGGEIDEYETLDLLAQLADKSLIIVEAQEGKSRYRLLETIRHYGLERALILSELPRLQSRHSHWCTALAEEAEQKLTGLEQIEWLDRLEREHDNLRAALLWAKEQCEREGAEAAQIAEASEIGLRIAGALWRFWEMRSYFNEGWEQLERILALPVLPTLATSSTDLAPQSQSPQAPSQYLQPLRAKALNGAGVLAYQQGYYASAWSMLEESLAISRELEDKVGSAYSLNNLGLVAYQQGDYASARSLYEESLAIMRGLGNPQGMFVPLNNLGNVALAEGDYTRARSMYEENLTLMRGLGIKWRIAQALINLGNLAVQQGEPVTARSLYEENLPIQQELGDKVGIAISLMGLGWVAAELGQAQQGAKLLGAAEALLGPTGSTLELEDGMTYERSLASARAKLSEDEFEGARAEGRTMRMDDAIKLALSATSSHPAQEATQPAVIVKLAAPNGEYPNDLTKREVELLRLVASGKTNKEIAAQLSLSVHTVESHLHSVYGKIGVTTRGAASQFAIQHNLI